MVVCKRVLVAVAWCAFLSVPAAATEGFYKDVFLLQGNGIGSSSMRTSVQEFCDGALPTMSCDFMNTSTVEELAGGASDPNGVILYPDGQPRYRMIVVPGGDSIGFGNAVGSSGREHVRIFFHNGGCYTGCCAGMFLACQHYNRSLYASNGPLSSYFHLWPWPASHAYSGREDPDLDLEPGHPVNDGFGTQVGYVYFNSGGSVNKSYSEGQDPNTEYIATYVNAAEDNATINGKWGVWSYTDTPNGGRLTIAGCHPESRSATRPYMKSMFSYSISRWDELELPVKQQLDNGVPVTMDVSNEKVGDKQYHYFTIDVPSGASFLQVTLTGIEADCDLYVMAGARATVSDYDESSHNGGTTDELVTVSSPEAGQWYILVHGYHSNVLGSAYTVQADWDSGGPFIVVTSPDGGETWNAGDNEAVTWVSGGGFSGNVDIQLSTDGGATYSIDLLVNTANDGSETITVPSVNSTTCRVRVRAAGGGTSDSSNGDFTIMTVNQAPTADAGADQNVTDDSSGDCVVTVTLDGSGSSDLDLDPLTYTWTVVRGSGLITLYSGTSDTATFGFPVGTHAVTLEVDDGNGGTDTDTVTITVNPYPGIIVMDNKHVDDPQGDGVTWNGSWYASEAENPYAWESLYAYADGDSYRWTPDIPAAGNYQVAVHFTTWESNRAPAAPFEVVYDGGSQVYPVDMTPAGYPGDVWLVLGTHSFVAGNSGYVELTRTGSGGTVVADGVRFWRQASGVPPAADAGEDQTVVDGDGGGTESVTLDGSGSNDPDGTIESWIWNEGGSQIATGQTAGVTLGLDVHDIELTVTDNDGNTDTDSVRIIVDDRFSGNGTSAAAQVLTAGTYADLFAYLQRQGGSLSGDWYSVDLPLDGNLSVTVEFLHDGGDLDLFVYESDGVTELGRSESATDDESLSFAELPAGTYFIEVYAYREFTDANTYSLTVDVVTGGGDSLHGKDGGCGCHAAGTASPAGFLMAFFVGAALVCGIRYRGGNASTATAPRACLFS